MSRLAVVGYLKRLWFELWHGPSYIMFAHPSAEHDLRCLKARNEWYLKYHFYREEARHGRWMGELTPRQIMALELPKAHCEIGFVQGMRFIQSGAGL